MYTYNMRVGFSHVDSDRVMKMEMLPALLQDVTCFQGEELGVGFEYLEPLGCAWILNAWQIDVKRMPQFNEKITIGTFPTEFRGFIGTRNFIIKDEDDNTLVMANSVWTFMDMKKLRPSKVAEKFIEVYTLEEQLPMEYLPRKITLPEIDDSGQAVSEKEVLKVREYHLDSNKHVNNGQYIQIACAFLPEGIKYDRLRVEYRKQAKLGDVMLPVVYKKEGCCIVALCDEEKSPYAIVEASMITG